MYSFYVTEITYASLLLHVCSKSEIANTLQVVFLEIASKEFHVRVKCGHTSSSHIKPCLFSRYTVHTYQQFSYNPLNSRPLGICTVQNRRNLRVSHNYTTFFRRILLRRGRNFHQLDLFSKKIIPLLYSFLPASHVLL